MRARHLLGVLAVVSLVVVACAPPGGIAPPGAAAVPRPSGAVPPSVVPASPEASDPGPSPVPIAPGPSVPPSHRPMSAPARIPVDVVIVGSPGRVFASEASDVMCAPAAIQITVNIVTGRPDRSPRFQHRIDSYRDAFTVEADSHNGEWGPAAEAAAIRRFSGVPYEVRVARSRPAALRDAAATIRRTGRPVVLLAWRGAHNWVMTGFRATADPIVFADAQVTGAYILDPWYPRVSSIWGRSDPPGTFQDAAEMRRNYLPWKRPDGRYPTRDGRFVYLAPVEP